MKIRWLFLLLFLIGLVVIELTSVLGAANRVKDLKLLLSDNYELAVSLEREIGYGGLIHNFKNFILRPEEENYYYAAKQNAKNALALIDQMARNAQELNLSIDLPETRTMVTAYGDRLDTVKEMNAEKADPFEIDPVVRFNDEEALQEIDGAMTAISQELFHRLARLETTAHNVQLLVASLLILGIVSDGVYLTFVAAHTRRLKSTSEALANTNQALVKTNTALHQFAGIASHDLKSPIGHVLHFCKAIEEDIDEKDKVVHHVGDIKKSAERMRTLVASLLEFTKAGFATPQLENVDLSEVIQHVLLDLKADIEKTNAEIDLKALPTVHADPDLLTRVFSNLIGNSLKYVHDGAHPKITIDSEIVDGSAIISISDNGIGVDPAYADKIFEPMQRLHRSSSKYPGVGIGLSLVQSIVDGHGGRVWLNPDYKGGAKFSLSLPTAKPQESADAGH